MGTTTNEPRSWWSAGGAAMPPIGQCRVDPRADEDAAERERQLLRAVGQGLLSGLPLAAGLTPGMQQAVIAAAAAALSHGVERYGKGASVEEFLSRVLVGAPLAGGSPGLAAVIEAARGAMGRFGAPILAATTVPPGPGGPGGDPPAPEPEPPLEEILLDQVSLPTDRELEILKELGRRGEYEIRVREVLEWQKGPRGATRRPRVTYPQWGQIPCTPGWDVIRQRLQTAFLVETTPAPVIPGLVSIPSWGLLGMQIHQRVQDIYFTTHPGNVVVADRTVRSGGRSYELSQFSEHLPRPLIDHETDDRLRILDESLRFAPRSLLRADIVDMTANRVFELKPRSWAQAAVVQVWHYQACFNLAMGAMAGKTAPVAPYAPGRCDTPGALLEGHWPLEPITLPLNPTGSLIAVVFHDPELPGVILYDVYRTLRPGEENARDQAWPELAWILGEILRRMGKGKGGGSGSGEGGGEGGGGGKVIPLRPAPAPAPAPDEEWEIPAAAIVIVVVIVLIVLAIFFLPEIVAALAAAAAAIGALLLAAWEVLEVAEVVVILAELMGAAAAQLARGGPAAGRDGPALAAVLLDARKALVAPTARG
ncbi:MAG TPA: hypothetical protein VFJ82_17570 [Longimicrobium sp.]|nr:hypothetical protein [Longimicrobium sp.]